MSIKRINPPQLYDSLRFGFSHGTRQSGSGDTVHLAGQVAWEAQGSLVGAGDLAAQTRQALYNPKVVLENIGAGPADVIRLRTYVVKHTPDKLGPVKGEIAASYGTAVPAPNTFIGAASLALPDFLLEIEAVAEVPK